MEEHTTADTAQSPSEGHSQGHPLQAVETAIRQVIVGQTQTIRHVLVALLADGHVILEGAPGLAKTTLIKALAQAMALQFQRIQFAPDLLPSDIVGTRIYEARTFTTRLGPIMANLVLADEINRAPAKVQAALLEAMQERQVTIAEHTHHLPQPFMVLATQNPLEQEGTYPLPEAQVDRFLLKILVDYPNAQEESQLLQRYLSGARPAIEAMLAAEDLAKLRAQVQAVQIHPDLQNYCIELVRATRPGVGQPKLLHNLVEYGASPRAVLALADCSRALAFLNGRTYVTPEDIHELAPPIFRHRVLPSFAAEADDIDSEAIIERLLAVVPLP
jgi:MoxR-like ATPase